MADRWSNPSGSLGVHRFRVWPDSEDNYDHAELAQNWDTIDRIIGVPNDGTDWPATTGEGGGIYAEVQDLRLTILPVGFVVPWHRPSLAVPIPTGFEVCDGSVVAEADHDFGAIGDVTLPDLRNRFVVGANPSTTIGQAGVAATHGDIDNEDGAPGPQGVGGENQHAVTVAEMASHRHAGSKTGWSSLGLHWYTNTGSLETVESETILVGASNATSTGQGGWNFGQHKHLINSLAAAGSSAVHENRPAYFGLIFLVKVKNA